MNDLMSNLENWTLVVMVVITLAGTTMETLVKPFIHAIVGKAENGELFKASSTYDYLIRMIVFAIAYLEAYPFRAELDIFAVLNVDGIPEFVGVIMAAIAVTFFSKQIHDLATFFKAWGSAKAPKDNGDVHINTFVD